MKIPKNLLTIGDAKTSKGEKLGYKTAILYMSPHKQNSKGKNLCAFASAGCAAACLYTAGRGKFSNVKSARVNKSEYFLNDQNAFLYQLIREIDKLQKKHGNTLVIRLNGTTDIPWENIKTFDCYNLFQIFPYIQFYDYTKNPNRVLKNRFKNYHLVFSRSEEFNNQISSNYLLNEGFSVAIVVNKDLYKDLSENNVKSIFNSDKNVSLVNGDLHDLRFKDTKNSIVYLKAKGDANKDLSGFVINTVDQLMELIK